VPGFNRIARCVPVTINHNYERGENGGEKWWKLSQNTEDKPKVT
jgi:hypothetical protein